jgi:hypothetical protein
LRAAQKEWRWAVHLVALTAAHSAEKMAGHWAAKKVVSMVVETAAWRVSQMAD